MKYCRLDEKYEVVEIVDVPDHAKLSDCFHPSIVDEFAKCPEGLRQADAYCEGKIYPRPQFGKEFNLKKKEWVLDDDAKQRFEEFQKKTRKREEILEHLPEILDALVALGEEAEKEGTTVKALAKTISRNLAREKFAQLEKQETTHEA